MNKKVKEFLKILLASFLLLLIIMVPAVLFLGLYLATKFLYDIGLASGYPSSLASYFAGSMAGTFISFLFFMWLVSSKRLTFTKSQHTKETHNDG